MAGLLSPKPNRIVLERAAKNGEFDHQTKHPMSQASLPHWWPIAAVILAFVACVGLYLFIKIEKLLFKLAGGFVALLLLAGAVWWFFLRR